MSHNEKNSNSVGTQQNQPEDSFDLNKTMQNLPNSDIANDHKKLKERMTDLLKGDTEFSKMKQGDKILVVSTASGLFTAVLPLLAVGATLAIPGAIVGLALYFAVKVAVKAVQSGYKGLKWSAEKTVDGAKYTAEKVKDASTYAAGKAREGYHSVKGAISSVGKAAKEGTGATLGKMGRSLSNLSESMSSLDAIPYSTGNEGQTVVLKTEEETRNFNSVKEMLIKEILGDKAVNSSALTKEIFSKLGEKILEKAYSVDDQSGFQKDQLINRLKQQVDFVNKLDAKKLQNLLSKDNNSLYEIFSEHHDKIKRIIGECKREYEFYQSVGRNNAKDAEERKASKSSSFSSVFSLGRKDSTQSTSSLSRSNSLNSVKTDSTVSSEAELLNPAEHKEVKAPSSFREKMPSWLGDKKAPKETTNVKYQVLSESDTLPRKIGNSTFYVAPPKPPRSNSLNSIGTVSTATVSSSGSKDFAIVNPNRLSRSSSFSGYDSPKLTPVDPPKLSRSSSTDSGFNSSTSSPAHTMFANEDGKVKTQADLNPTSHTLWGKPSTKVDEIKPESTQVKTVG
ncbi:hypothetical protein HCR18_03695 [Wolbachia pipientis]|uniref:actin-bundling T4SS effector WalE1 family protein n=1 Tax=Wolbachia pipientis TaxID=955 RepID=UPI0015FB7D62|nr:hypothetical protein [Wolbachia pipientis]MBA8758159.1 hypothetical protein [Wolbachia pipientis]